MTLAATRKSRTEALADLTATVWDWFLDNGLD